MKHILVIGSINVDLVIHTPRLPAIGETIRGGGFQTVPAERGLTRQLPAACWEAASGCWAVSGGISTGR